MPILPWPHPPKNKTSKLKVDPLVQGRKKRKKDRQKDKKKEKERKTKRQTERKNSAISSFTLHNIAPLITLATQYKYYGGRSNNNTT